MGEYQPQLISVGVVILFAVRRYYFNGFLSYDHNRSFDVVEKIQSKIF